MFSYQMSFIFGKVTIPYNCTAEKNRRADQTMGKSSHVQEGTRAAERGCGEGKASPEPVAKAGKTSKTRKRKKQQRFQRRQKCPSNPVMFFDLARSYRMTDTERDRQWSMAKEHYRAGGLCFDKISLE